MKKLIGASLAVCIAVTTLNLPSAMAVEPDESNAGASWLASQLTNARIPSTWVPGTTDWGLTADVVFALTARQTAGNAADAATDALAGNILSYISPAGGASRSAGGVAKSLLVAATQGQNVTNFGGEDLLATLQSLKATAGADAGRFRDVGTPFDYSSSFSQSLALIALTRLDSAPADAVQFLLNMQCEGGGFPYSPSPETSRCNTNAEADNDATAMALHALTIPALQELPGVADARELATTYLLGEQQTNGSFDAPPWVGPNASTTGLASAALRLAGETVAADRASQWLTSLAITCVNARTSKATSGVGLIAPDPAALSQVLANGVTQENVDGLRRATSQALLGLPDSQPLTTMTRASASNDVPERACPLQVIPLTQPRLLSVRYEATGRSAAVRFTAQSDQLLVRNKRPGENWSGWRPARARSVASFRTPTVLQVIAGPGRSQSQPLTVSLNSKRTGVARGCAPMGAVTVTYRSGRPAFIRFAMRQTSCARVSVDARRWQVVRAGQRQLDGTGLSSLRFKTGGQLLSVALGTPR